MGALDITGAHLGASTRTDGEAYAAADAAAVGEANISADAAALDARAVGRARPSDGRARPETDRRAGARAHAAALDARAHASTHTKALSGTFTKANAQTHAEPVVTARGPCQHPGQRNRERRRGRARRPRRAQALVSHGRRL